MAIKAKKKHAHTKIPESVVITMVVDESGSMAHLYDATVAGFNEYVTTLQKDKMAARSYFSAITFDTRGIRKLQVGANLNEAIKLGRHNYQPTGGTPLLDAVGVAIAATDQVMAAEEAKKAIVVIQTDGEENSSREQNLSAIKVMIEERQAKGWQFVFIGAGINAFADASKMGIHALNTMSYSADATGTQNVYAATAHNSTLFGSGLTVSMNYSEGQSRSAGEKPEILRAKLFATRNPKPGA